jgi:hypothetical protein
MLNRICNVLVLGCGLWAGSAAAAPVFVYGFSVESCVADQVLGSACNSETIGELKASFISLTHDAVQARTASYYYQQPIAQSATPPVFLNDGVAGLSLPRPGGLGHRTFLPPDCTGSCETDIAVQVGPGVNSLLSGHVSMETWSDNLGMTGIGGIWAGRMTSDRPGYFGEFTGRWTLAQVLPEPGAIYLTLAALALGGLFSRHRMRT